MKIITSSLCILIFGFYVVAQDILLVDSVNANLRGTPSAKGEIVTVLPKYSALEEIKKAADWYLVQSQKYVGWIHSSTVIRFNSVKPNKSNKQCENGTFAFTKVDKVQFFQSPSGATLMVLPKGRPLTLLSKGKYNSHYWVLDNKTKLKGYVVGDYLSFDCVSNDPISRVPRTTTKLPTGKDNFKSVYTGTNTIPTIAVVNRTDRTLQFSLGGVNYKIFTGKTRTISVAEGNYEYTVSAKRVRSFYGVKTFERGVLYTLTYTIVTRRL